MPRKIPSIPRKKAGMQKQTTCFSFNLSRFDGFQEGTTTTMVSEMQKEQQFV
jgi:hypothetical protein